MDHLWISLPLAKEGAWVPYESATVGGFFFIDTAPTEIYTRPYTLSLHDALPISGRFDDRLVDERVLEAGIGRARRERRSEEHTSELQSHGLISYAVFCLKKKKANTRIKKPLTSKNKTKKKK